MSNNFPPEQNERVARREGKEVKGIQSIRHTSRGLKQSIIYNTHSKEDSHSYSERDRPEMKRVANSILHELIDQYVP
jgi:hypothetical protein